VTGRLPFSWQLLPLGASKSVRFKPLLAQAGSYS